MSYRLCVHFSSFIFCLILTFLPLDEAGLIWIQNGFKEYYISDIKVPQQTAQFLCKQSSAHLPRISHQFEFNFLTFHMDYLNIKTESKEIYMDVINGNKTLEWGDGTRIDRLDDKKEDDLVTNEWKNDSCMSITADGEWKWRDCDEKLYFVCERNVATLWSSWQSWSSCSSTCYHGYQMRYRHCMNMTQEHGTAKCKAYDIKLESRACNEEFCTNETSRLMFCESHCNNPTSLIRRCTQVESCKENYSTDQCVCEQQNNADVKDEDAKWITMTIVGVIILLIAVSLFSWNCHRQRRKFLERMANEEREENEVVELNNADGVEEV